jgi:Flp pilus assembly pilin Flp
MAGIFHFLKDRRGATATEFALIALVFAGILVAIIDFSRALWEYNRAVKACQVGVRYAVVNDMVPDLLASWNGVSDGGIVAGQPIPVGDITPNPVSCTASACTPAGWGFDATAYNNIVDEMAAIFPPLVNDPNAVVTVTYEHIGMGFAGNPFGPDVWPLTTVEITGFTFDFFTPLINIADIQFPECSATLTGEDFNT